MNGEASAAMRNRGLRYQLNYGLDAMAMRDLAAQYTPDATLAGLLWNESSRECKILATMIQPKDSFTPAMADEWLDACFTTELQEQLCFNLLQHLPFAPAKALEWIHAAGSERQSAGYSLLLRLILSGKPLPELNEARQLAETAIRSEHFQLQLQAGKFLERISTTD